MKSISLREFQRNASAYTEEMVELTQYGKVIGTFLPSIIKVKSPKMKILPEKVSTDVSTQTRKLMEHQLKVSTHEERSILQPQNRNWCYFCGNRGAIMHKYQYTDGSGEGENYFCDPCWKKYENSHVSIGMTPNLSNHIRQSTDLSDYRGAFPKPVKKKKGERT